MELNCIKEKLENGRQLTRDEAIRLLSISTQSNEFYELLSLANELSRREYKNKGYIFAQLGINAESCSGECKFCSLGAGHFSVEYPFRLNKEDVLKRGTDICNSGISDFFLMTTADYPFEQYIQIGKELRNCVPESVRFVANIGDFNFTQALELKNAGFDGAYHINRLNEGLDTAISPDKRIATLNAVKEAGLELYYCIEPIGPEHSHESIVDEMIRARHYDVDAMAVMRRIPVKGTPLWSRGQISSLELVKIAAVTRLVVRPGRSMNVHEPTEMAMLAGVNQLYAEFGSNPRDVAANTDKGRGFTINEVKKMLEDSGYNQQA